jgi:hypothetical protein
MVDLERRLRDYGAHLDSSMPRVTTSEILQRAEGLEPVVLRPPRPRWTPVRVALVAAIVTLILFLPILLWRDSTESPVVDDPVTTVVPGPATSVPSTPSTSGSTETDSFESVTSLGTIEWIKVESERRIEPQGVVDGLIHAVEFDADFNVIGHLQSTDGINWEPTEVPEFSPWSRVFVGDETLAPVSPGGFGGSFGSSSRQVRFRSWGEDPEADLAMFRQEGSEWVQVALPATELSPVAGLEILGPQFQGVAGKDGSNWVAPVLYLVRVPWHEIYGTFPYQPVPEANPTEIGPWPIWNEGLQVLEIFQPGVDGMDPGELLASLNVAIAEGDPQTIEFRDEVTGELVHTVEATLPGWTAEEMMAGIRGWGLFDVSFVVSREGELSVVRPPWPMGEEWTLSGIVESSDRYYTHTLTPGDDYAANAIHLWESEDGLDWSEVGLPTLHDGRIDYVTLAGGGDRLFMVIENMGGSGSVWTSTNARDWQEIDPGNDDIFFQPERTDFGWLSSNAFGAVSLSGDGLTWEQLEMPGNPVEPKVTYMDGVFILSSAGEGPPFVMWVGRFVD